MEKEVKETESLVGMTHVGEKLVIMDNATTTFRNQKRISLSRSFVLFLIFLFIFCLLATGLLVYHFSSCSHSSLSSKDSAAVTSLSCNNCTTPETALSEDIATSTITTTTTTLEVSSTTIVTLDTNNSKTKNLRLDGKVVPHSYKLKLIPFIFESNFTFHGEVTILVNVTENTSKITLHADQLDIDGDSIQVYREGDDYAQIEVVELLNYTKSDFFNINLEEELKEGEQYNIFVRFKGVLNDLMEGFYRSSYQDGKETRWLAATQFQPTDARKAFPCFDEPALKARFQVSLGRPKNMTSISNLPKVRKSEDVEGLEGYVWDHFQETVPMSTYLLAFVVSDFEHLTKGNFSVWARHSAISQAKYGLEIGPQILKFYEQFFNIEFPLPKIDMVALPDFSSGAMENWGLITFRESLLLYQEEVSSTLYLPIIGGVIAHELAHQWFGNLVTPSWWSDLWLNEGFATYLEYIAINAVKPQWRVLDQFITSELQAVFSVDSLQTSHRISTEVDDTDEIQDIFDQISYSKAATIIRMMDYFLTTEVFKKGLTNFLNERKYGSATQDDLWEMLTQQAHTDGILEEEMTVKEIMDTWTLQTGYPVVNVTRNYEEGSIVMTQQRFFVRYGQSDPEGPKWWIPITFKSKSTVASSVWIKAEEKIVISDSLISLSDWLLVNVNQTGFYRVNYDVKNWEILTQQLLSDHTVFDPKNRAQMLDDSMNLAAARHLSYEIALNVTRYLTKETDLVPWKSAMSAFEYLNDMFVRTAHFDKLKAYMIRLLTNLYKTIGFNYAPNDELLTVSKRSLVLRWACQLGVTDCIVHANRQFESWRNSPDPDKNNAISPDLRQTIYCTAIRDGGQEHWDFVWDRVRRSNVSTERVMMMFALGCSREIWILSRYLEWSVTDSSGIRKQDIATVFNAVTNNPVGQELAYRFLKNNWSRMKRYLGASSVMLTGVVSACTNNLNTKQEVEDLQNFIQQQSLDQGVTFRTVKQATEQAEANVQWMEFNFEKIVEWLSRQPN